MVNYILLCIFALILVNVGNDINGFVVKQKSLRKPVLVAVYRPTIYEEITSYTKSCFNKIRFLVAASVNKVSNAFRGLEDSQGDILGAPCNSNSNCSAVSDSICTKGICKCTLNFTATYNTPDRCIKVLQLGETCEENEQCSTRTVNSICVGRCVCPDIMYLQEQDHCVLRKKLGDNCQKEYDCLVSEKIEEPNLRQCLNNTCVCKPGYSSTEEDNHCMKAFVYQWQISLAWLLVVFVVPYLF